MNSWLRFFDVTNRLQDYHHHYNIQSVFYLAYWLANNINSIWYNCKHDKISVDVVIHVFHSILNVEDTISADFGASSGSWSLSLSRCFLILQYFTSVYKSAIRISIPEIDKAAMQPPSVHVLPEMRHNLTWFWNFQHFQK